MGSQRRKRPRRNGTKDASPDSAKEDPKAVTGSTAEGSSEPSKGGVSNWRETRDKRFEEWATTNSLTPAEGKVARLVCWGLDDRTIALKLRIAVSTVRSHTEKICLKLGVHRKQGICVSWRSFSGDLL